MIFQDNVVKEYLRNVLFITGTPCGGKTTISRELGRKHGLMVYDADERFAKHQRMSSARYQPAMNQKFKNADAFFYRTPEEYSKWLRDNTREQLDYVLMDLIQLSRRQIILCHLHLTVEQADVLTDSGRIVFLIRNPSNIIDDYCNRPDHSDFASFINSTTNPVKAKANCNHTLQLLHQRRYEQIKQSHYFWLERGSNRTIEDTLARVEQHFHL